METVHLVAPFDGWLVPLAEVPDPAFAGGMIGEGAAIDPLDGALRAPCDGVVSSVAKARHAVTIRADNGAEILLHIGIDTVDAGGVGLTVRVEPGQRVRQGDALVDVDLDALLSRASSLVTPIVVVNADAFRIRGSHAPGRVRRGEPLLEIRTTSQSVAAVPEPRAHAAVSEEVAVAWPHGMHARPAAQVVQLSRRYAARVTLSLNGSDADSRSMVALMALAAARGDRVRVGGTGEDAAEAVRAVASLLATPAVDPGAPAGAGRRAVVAGERPAAAGDGEFSGIVASRGLAIGTAQHLPSVQFEVREAGEDGERERGKLHEAIRDAAARLRRPGSRALADDDILGAQRELLEDPGLLADAEAAIGQGKSAGFAWRQATRRARAAFTASGDARIAERAADLRDVEEQVLRVLAPAAAAGEFELAEESILLAEDLLPSQLSRLSTANLAGFCCAGGGPTSHVALMAAARDIPALVACGPGILQIPAGTQVLLDAHHGVLRVSPAASAIADAKAAMQAGQETMAALLRAALRDAVTADGVRIEVFANLASEAEAHAAVRRGAEGCGLLRTELLYLDRDTAPGRDEQATIYQAIADALGDRPLTIRTLDIGGDKRLSYLPLPPEDNPLLGLRGLRASLRFPGLLEDQLAAILEVEPRSRCRILLPMITGPGEIRAVRRMVATLVAERESAAAIAIGAMIETPASVALASAIAREADFLSIGSNDLAQYTLATDRTHPVLSASFDHLHPAVLRQIAAVCEAVAGTACSVSVCGGLASEPAAVPVLLGLGVRTLSVVPGFLPELKALIGKLTLEDCRAAAEGVLAEDDAASARRRAEAFLNDVREGGPA